MVVAPIDGTLTCHNHNHNRNHKQAQAQAQRQFSLLLLFTCTMMACTTPTSGLLVGVPPQSTNTRTPPATLTTPSTSRTHPNHHPPRRHHHHCPSPSREVTSMALQAEKRMEVAAVAVSNASANATTSSSSLTTTTTAIASSTSTTSTCTTNTHASGTTSATATTTTLKRSRNGRLPKVIIFDLDGCLWRPEMYELLHFSGGRGAPFTYSPNYATDGTLYSRGAEPVRLLCQARDVLRELHVDKETWEHVLVGISSRTDQPDWAQELLQKFTITIRKEDEGKPEADSFTLQHVVQQGPIEIAKDSKVEHFKRIAAKTGVSMHDMLFFDNERCNCRDIAELGVVVVYSPDGVTTQLWEHALQAFPNASGQILGLDMAPDYPSDYRRTKW